MDTVHKNGRRAGCVYTILWAVVHFVAIGDDSKQCIDKLKLTTNQSH